MMYFFFLGDVFGLCYKTVTIQDFTLSLQNKSLKRQNFSHIIYYEKTYTFCSVSANVTRRSGPEADIGCSVT